MKFLFLSIDRRGCLCMAVVVSKHLAFSADLNRFLSVRIVSRQPQLDERAALDLPSFLSNTSNQRLNCINGCRDKLTCRRKMKACLRWVCIGGCQCSTPNFLDQPQIRLTWTRLLQVARISSNDHQRFKCNRQSTW